MVGGLSEFVVPGGGVVEVCPLVEESAGRAELAAVFDDLANGIEWRTGRGGEFFGSRQAVVGGGEGVGRVLNVAM